MSKFRVVVVGGGWAGIAAADSMASAGLKVTLVERQPVLGGRCSSYWDESFGEWLDHGSHLFSGAYKCSLSLLERWGSHAAVDFEAGDCIPWIDAKGCVTYLRTSEGDFGALLGLVKLRAGRLPDRFRTALAVARLRSGGVIDTAVGETLRTFLDKQGIRPNACGGLWEALSVAVMNAPPEQAAAQPLAAALGEGLLRGGKAGRLGVPAKSLHEIIAEPAHRFLTQSGVDIRLKCEARALVKDGGGRVAKVITTAGGLDCEAVVSAIESYSLKSLLERSRIDSAPAALALTNEWGAIATVHLQFDRQIIFKRLNHLACAHTHWLIGRGEPSAGGWSKLSAVISAAPAKQEAANRRLLDWVMRDIAARIPAARNARLLASQVIRVAKAVPTLTPDRLHQRPPVETSISNFFLCGDWTATGLPATIEGAARSGAAAANQVIKISKVGSAIT